MRWMFKFTRYQYTFKYKPGKENVVADCLSRNPVTTLPEWEINRNLHQLRILMIKRKNESTRASSSDTSTPNNPRKGVTSSSAADASCIAQRTRSKIKAVASPANPPKTRKPVSSKVDTGLRRRSNLTRPMDAIPEETTSMTNQQRTTAQEDGPTETPPLVDPRYSALRQEFTDTERSTDDETQSQVQEDNCPTVPDTATAPENKTNVIITAPPITDSNTYEGEDTLDETEEVFTQLSDAELLKAANEINISQNLIDKKAFELEDINAEMELENNELNNKSCFSEGDCADETIRDYLDSIDTFDERNFTDKTLTDKVNRLVAKSLATTKDSDILIRGREHKNLNKNNFNKTSHIKPMPSNDIPQDQNNTSDVLNFT
uniref:Reverse transcriptase RNase H-like domain-containing protein n=1 Tax=Trichogramma kaykai TaxID=54128 RepID=A0ABD2WHB2_9HYME